MELENNAFFWQKVDTLFLSSQLKVTRQKGETHPEYKNLIYPVDYGRLVDTANSADNGISVYIGSGKHSVVNSLIVAADILKKDLDIKILVGCNEEEEEAVLRFLNQTDFQKTILIRRGSEIPSWGITD